MVKKMLLMIPLLFLLSAHQAAAEQGGIELKSVSEVEITVQNDKGEDEILRVDTAMANVTSGDTVIFTNYYENLGEKPMDDVVLVNPVPVHMIYVADTAEGAGTIIEFSVDQGQSYNTPEKLRIKDEEGKEKVAEATDYTHIRWVFTGSIGKGGDGNVSFRAKVK
jgi:uncharacterized repeat protein (TIGR01451 family)